MKTRNKFILILSCACAAFVLLASIPAAFYFIDYWQKQQDLLQRQAMLDEQLAMQEQQALQEQREIDELMRLIDESYNRYSEKVSNIETAALDIFNERQQFILNTILDIEELLESFNTVETPLYSIFSTDNNAPCGRAERFDIYEQLYEMSIDFSINNNFDSFYDAIYDLVEELKYFFDEITSDSTLTESDNIMVLCGIIEELIEIYSEKINTDDYSEVLDIFDTILSDMSNWFYEYYLIALDEILDREFRNDKIKGMEQQIADIEVLKTIIASDTALSSQMLVSLYNSLDSSSEDLSKELQILKEAAQAAALPPPTPSTPSAPSTPSSPSAPAQPPVQPPAGVDVVWLASEVLRLTNVERANYGAPALQPANALLYQAAGIRAEEIITLFSHTRPDGRDCFSSYTDLGGTYYYLGENLAAGYRSAQSVVQGWMDSPGHMRNMIDPEFTHLAVAVTVDGNGRMYWVQLFMG